VRSAGGNITLTGTSNGSGNNNTGIRLSQGRVESLGTGNVTLGGVGGNGTDRNQGISLLGATVQASSGNVTLTGSGRGSGTLNHGISVESIPTAPIPTTIQTADLGKVTLRDAGSAGTGTNFGISMNSGTVRSQNGDIALIGTGIGTSTNNDGINLSTGGPITVQATGTGNISLTGSANNNSIPINLISGVIDATGGNVTLTGDEIQLSGTTQVNGKGTITLEPLTPSLGILIGGTQNTPDAPLNLIQTEVDTLKGFAQMVIGRTNGTGAIAVDPAGVQFNSLNTATTIQPPTGTGSIAVNGPITAQGNITFNGATSLSADVTASDKIITFNSPVTVANKVNLNTGAGAGNILFQKTVDGTTTNTNSQDLTLTAGSGNIIFGGDAGSVTPLGNLTINSAGNVQTKAITAASITQTAGTGTTAFKGPVTTNAAGGINLTGTNFAIENPVTTLNNGTFKVNNSGELNIATGANLVLDGEFTQSGTGKVNIGSNITTTNDNISFNSPVTLTNDVSFNTGAGAGDIIFNNTVDGTTANSPNLTLTAGTGNIIFTTGAIGNSTTPFGAITANSSGTTSFASTVNAQSLTTDSGGTTKLNGNVTTTGPQTYGDAVTIANNPILSGSDITFNNTVDGSSDLTVNTVSGNVTFNYIDNSDITFNNTVDGSSALTVKEGTGNVTFNKAIGETTPLTSLTANSKISLGGNVTTTGSQTYGDAVTIANNPILSGSDITFNNTVDGSSALTVKEGTGNVTFNKAIGETTPLTSLTANSKISLGGNVTTTGPQTYGDAVTIANNPILSGSDITFNNTVDGSSALTVKEGTGNVTFNKAIGETTPLTSLTANSKISLGGNVTTTGPQTYGDAVTIANNPILSGSDITFNNTVDGSSALTVKEGTGNVTFNKAIGETTPLTSLTANSKISLGGNVTTTGPQTYGDAVTIANNPILSGSDITFNNTVDGSSDLTVKEGTVMLHSIRR
jgi:hypothetical protein